MFATDNGSLDYGRNYPAPGMGRTFPVDRFVPNPLGIYNLTGNATDWVNDWYDKEYYRVSPRINPTGPNTGKLRIHRGSGYLEDPLLSSSTVRRWSDSPVKNGYFQGHSFRCAVQSEKQF